MASNEPVHRSLQWKGILKFSSGMPDTLLQPFFEGAQFDRAYGDLPFYGENFPMEAGILSVRAEVENPVFDIAADELASIPGAEKIGSEVRAEAFITYELGNPVAIVRILPFRVNPYNGQMEVLVSFDLKLYPEAGEMPERASASNYAGHSVLATGEWFKFAVTETGIHIITYSDLQSMGINPASVDPRNIRIYGNGGGMLSENLTDSRRDDLSENAIYVSGENDGKFDSQDYILFYGQSPNKWQYQPLSQAFQHHQNIYSDSTYYFLTISPETGKRVSSIASTTAASTVNVSKFTDHIYHEMDLFNLVNTGRVWYGEVFDVTTTYNFNYSIPDMDVSSPAYLRAYVAAKSSSTTSFTFYNGNEAIMTASISGIPSSSETYARAYIGSDWFQPSSNNINLRISYDKTSSASIGWLNFFELNVTRLLKFTGPQMGFRDPASAGPGSVAEFSLGNAGQNVQVWNITDPTNAGRMSTSLSGGSQVFRVKQDTMQEFIAFDGSSYLPVKYSGKVPNQDLHGTDPVEMVIISHPLFLDQADRLANFHRDADGMNVLVTDINKVYNEFSSGAQDITAIRDFVKMLYDEAPEGEKPKYLLLFGDASFDYKNHIENNSNFVPTWEDDESLTIVYSIVTDDYYGFLDGPGDNLLDIGIGRMPVQTTEQAQLAVDKVIHYATNTPVVMKDWRNSICFVSDDEDSNLHLDQAEGMAQFLDTNYGEYNIDKIYVDAFPQISTPGGQRAPEVNQAINNQMNEGALVMNYTGHGGEVGWGHERFLEISDINTWSNYDMMPIFITATCEFSRYDDPERVSAGEMVYLNTNGGAIAMFTTARATFGGSNFNLNTALFEIMFEKENGQWYRFGDLIRIAKNRGGVVDNDRKFVLLGDPALHLAYPELDIFTTSINGRDVSPTPDTLQALSTITVEGEVMDGENLAAGFNGTIYPIVFDKPSRVTTLQTDPTSKPCTFDLQNNILYKGKARVVDGRFSFTFIVPKDIAYQYGFGKISYYAEDDNQTDAHGCYNNIMVGGLNQSIEPDEQGPNVQLYMNDEHFIFGGITDQNPVMLAYVQDDSGINTIGTGIGHDIVAILDGNTDKPIILNDFYESDLNSYTSGTIRFPFHELATGKHTLSLKVWDVFNNSGEAYLEFNVVSSNEFVIEGLSNYPNPFYNNTTFVISHNQSEGDLDVQLYIYNLAGQVVRTIQQTVAAQGYVTEAITWYGTDDSGNYLAQGVYIYRMSVKNSKGQVAGKDGKLILMN
jgi:hypothetical protein